MRKCRHKQALPSSASGPACFSCWKREIGAGDDHRPLCPGFYDFYP